jgi:8-oxo-dGTP pyrophosphatase MutT (NUDIX family)
VLGAWDAPDGEQAELREHYLRHLAEYADGMWRSCRPEHVTASALVVDGSGSRALLTLHKVVGMWLQLGGHCEPGDTTLAGAALREATEESGLSELSIDPAPLQLSRHEILAGGCAGTFHLDVQFLVTATASTDFVVSEESHDLAWFPLDALPDHVDHTVQQLARMARQRTATSPTR